MFRGGGGCDFDGDGRLSIRDVLVIGQTCFDLVGLAPGSLEVFESFPCYEGVPERKGPVTSHIGSHGIFIPNAVYLESLRRAASSPLPNYSPQSRLGSWPVDAFQDPLPAAAGVRIEILGASAPDGDGRAEVALQLQTDVPLRAFSLILESDERLLRPAYNFLERRGWRVSQWGGVNGLLSSEFDSGDLTVRSGLGAYLVTGGNLVVAYGITPCSSGTPVEILPGNVCPSRRRKASCRYQRGFVWPSSSSDLRGSLVRR